MHFIPNKPPKFEELIPPRGFLLDEPKVHALYHFLKLANRSIRRTKKEVEYEHESIKHERGIQRRLLNNATAVEKIHQLHKEEFFNEKMLESVLRQMGVMKVDIEPEVIHWIKSGGRSNGLPETADAWLKHN